LARHPPRPRANVGMVHESHRDAGLVRQLGPWALAASILGMVVGATIFVLPATLAATIGLYAPWVFVVCAVAVGSIAICFAEGGSRIPTSGGIYGYVQAAFGSLLGYIAGTLVWVGDVLACGAIAAALADAIVSVVPPAVAGAMHAAVILAAIAGIAFVNIGGVAHGARLVKATTTLKLIPLAIFIVVGAAAVHRSNFVQTATPSIGGLGRAMILGVFAFMGMETSLCTSGEVAHPTRTIPRALAIAMISATLLYVAVQIVAQGVLGSSLANSTVPLADAMAQINPALRVLMVAGAGLSMFGYIAGDILGSPRLLFAFARDGLLPRSLGRVHPRSHTPHIAILSYAALASGLALTGTFAELAVLSALSTAALYVIGCAAAWRLKRRGVALAGEALNFRWLGLATVIGMSSMLIVIALAARTEIIGLGVLVAASATIYLLQTRTARIRR
jgi:APA family basic amino acid/polyamine antiporter